MRRSQAERVANRRSYDIGVAGLSVVVKAQISFAFFVLLGRAPVQSEN